MQGHAAAAVVAALMCGGLANAQDKPKPADAHPENCFYSVGSQSVSVPLGKSVCRRQPAPYNDKYSLLRCNPPLDEIDSDIRRGDARCESYEERQ